MKPTKLDIIEKKVPFSVPDGYFDQLTSDIQERVSENPKQVWLPVPQLRWGLATAAVAVLVTFIWLYNGSETQSAEQLLAQVEEQALLDYLDLTEISDEELLNGVSTEVIDQLWSEDDAMDDLRLESIDLDALIIEYENEI